MEVILSGICFEILFFMYDDENVIKVALLILVFLLVVLWENMASNVQHSVEQQSGTQKIQIYSTSNTGVSSFWRGFSFSQASVLQHHATLEFILLNEILTHITLTLSHFRRKV